MKNKIHFNWRKIENSVVGPNLSVDSLILVHVYQCAVSVPSYLHVEILLCDRS